MWQQKAFILRDKQVEDEVLAFILNMEELQEMLPPKKDFKSSAISNNLALVHDQLYKRVYNFKDYQIQKILRNHLYEIFPPKKEIVDVLPKIEINIAGRRVVKFKMECRSGIRPYILKSKELLNIQTVRKEVEDFKAIVMMKEKTQFSSVLEGVRRKALVDNLAVKIGGSYKTIRDDIPQNPKTPNI